MFNRSFQNFIFTISFLVITLKAKPQDIQEPKTSNTEWSKPYPPFRIAGNLYYVGTYDLASYLITTTDGNILINTGLAASDSQIINNIRRLGFNFADIKVLLTTQAHYDHMGAMAAIKKMTGAQFMVDEKEAPVCLDGGKSDYALGGNTSAFAPVIPDRLLYDHDTIALGNMKLLMLHHPGHTKGSCSFLFSVNDGNRSYRVLIANMPTIITDKRFSEIPAYPEIAADYAYTMEAMKNISFDIWIASHASQFKLHEKHKPGDDYNPEAFIDREGYDSLLNELKQAYERKH